MKQIWGIRHLRWFWHSRALNLHLLRWEEAGFLGVAQQSDLDWLQAIWDGER